MRCFWSAAALAALVLTVPVQAADAPKADAKSYQVPYRLSGPKHVLVRAKINGKGPFNFILDTGAPAVFITKKVGEKAGIKEDKQGWGEMKRFEIEGGLVVPEAKCRVEDLFQLEGMNGLGLAGVEIHGVIGYNVIARYRIEFDFTKDKLVWIPLNFKPAGPFVPEEPKDGKGRASHGSGSLEILGQAMKFLGKALGRKASPDLILRGYLGLDITDKDEIVTVRKVAPGSPAEKAGIKTGDVIKKFKDRGVTDVYDIIRYSKKMQAGAEATLTIERDGKTQEITIKAGEGL